MGVDRVPVEGREPVHRRTQSDRLHDRRGPRLKPQGRLCVRDPVEVHPVDHLAPALPGWKGGQPVGPAPQHPDPGRSVELVPGEGHEVGVKVTDVEAGVDHRLAGVDDHHRTRGAGQGGDAADRVDRPQNIGHVDHRHHTGAGRDQTFQGLHVEGPVGQKRSKAQDHPLLLAQEVPGDDVGVVLHLGQDHLVTLGKIAPKARRHQVQGLGGAPGEDDLGLRRAYEGADLFPRVFIEFCGFIRQGMQAAVDVGVAVSHQVRHGLDDRLGLLGRGGAVQVDERPVADPAGEDRELAADSFRIKAHQSPAPIRACSQLRIRSAASGLPTRSITSPRKEATRRLRASPSGRPRWRM